MKTRITLVAGLILAAPTFGQFPPGEGPALGTNRITQNDITGGQMTLKQIRLRGMEIFSTPFNKHDGMGDGPLDPFNPDKTSPGNRPTMANNGTMLRANGLDSQACLECHSVVSNASIPARFGIGGVGGIAATAMPGAMTIDIDDDADVGFATYDGRMINPPFVFGAGGVELLAKEMTLDLQGLKATAQANPDIPVALITKGVNFGSILFDSNSQTFDTSQVEGIDDNLVVQPFGRKGNNQSIREFDIGALQFHQGMQPVEIVGTGTDPDGDGVVDEILVGELSAMHIFSVTLEKPVFKRNLNSNEQNGRALFSSEGCADCHIPTLFTDSRFLPVSFPEVDVDPMANAFLSIDLSKTPAKFVKSGSGLRVDLFSDLKRHNMGPGLAEMTGDALDPFFVTPRLWGVADTAPYLHDGRAMTLTDAIEAHGGDAAGAAANFGALSDSDKEDLLGYLRTLHTPTDPAKDLLESQANNSLVGPLASIGY